MKPRFGIVNHSDCIEGMKALDASVVDLAFADPPFNIGYDYDAYDDRQDHERYLTWCRDWMAELYRVLKPDGSFWLAIGDEYAAELKLVAQNAYPGLPLTLPGKTSAGESCDGSAEESSAEAPSPKRGPRRNRANEDDSAPRRGVGKNGRLSSPTGSTGRPGGFYCRSWVIWYYTFGVHCKYKFTRSHAHLFHFVKNPARFTFNVDAVRVPSARQLVYGDRRASAGGRTPDDTWIIPPTGDPRIAIVDNHDDAPASNAAPPAHNVDGFVLRPQDIPDRFEADSDTWYFSRVAGTFKEREGWHGCQMPEQLLGRIIRASSNVGETVLDPFGGSGTTLVVARKLDRIPIGFEMSQQYARHAQKRLEAVKPGDPLDGASDPLSSAPSTRNGRRLEDKRRRFAGGTRKRAGQATESKAASGPDGVMTLF